MREIQTESIPSAVTRELVKPVFDSAVRFYEDPDNVRAFEEWLKTRKEQ